MTRTQRVIDLEDEGLTTSDAQAVADAEQLQGRVFDLDPYNLYDFYQPKRGNTND